MPEFIYSVFPLRNGVEFRESSLLPPLQSASRTAVEAWVLANFRPPANGKCGGFPTVSR